MRGTSVICAVLLPVMAGYVFEVVRELDWGRGPGEVGLIEAEGQEPQGPGAVAVGPDYDIYILDTVNRRVLRLDEDGKLRRSIPLPFPALSFCVDEGGKLYALDPDRRLVAVCGQDGCRELSYTLPVDGTLPVTRILAYEGQVWLGTYRDVYPVQLLPKAAKLARGTEGIPGPSGRFYRVTPGEDEHTAYVEASEDGSPVLRLVVRSEEPLGTVEFLKEDEGGNMYIYSEGMRITGAGIEVRRHVLRYGPYGELLDRIDIPVGYTYCYGGDLDVDRKGNVYQLLTLKEGVRVVRWRLR
ncbi:MAG TPA: hypothetical protein EYP61_03345 [Candidatus Latescibacteria bacterium]|nr:hypothetical protein [Candidatus Latescibacterota bacterium]